MPLLPKSVRAALPSHVHFSVVRIVRLAIITFFALLTSTVAALVITNALRKRPAEEKAFPHLELGPVRVGKNTLQLYSYGRDLYDAMLAAIDQAKESIYIESYIWKGDEVGQQFKMHLEKKAAEGVDVYVIFDSFANLVVPRVFKAFAPAVHVLAYQAIHIRQHPWHVLDPRRYSLDHRKLLIVDGHTAFIGGYNIGSLYATEWRDTHLRIQGPSATDLAYSFSDFWNEVTLEERIVRRYPRVFDPTIIVHENDALRLTFPIRNMYIAAINTAERAILISNAYFLPDHVLLDALKAAAQRGVDVRILIPWDSNHVVVDWVVRSYLTECLKAGIRVLGYKHMLHAKTCMIDDQWLTVGTANLDRLSSIGNYEVNVEVYSAELARQMRVLFECDMGDVSELKLDEWQHRAWYVKASELILAPLRNFL